MKLSMPRQQSCWPFFSPDCATLVLQPANFAWPIELFWNPMPKHGAWMYDMNSTATLSRCCSKSGRIRFMYRRYTLRIIRDQAGYYYIHRQGFKNVYIFAQTKALWNWDKKIQVSEKELEARHSSKDFIYSALWMRKMKMWLRILINKDGIQQGEKKWVPNISLQQPWSLFPCSSCLARRNRIAPVVDKFEKPDKIIDPLIDSAKTVQEWPI